MAEICKSCQKELRPGMPEFESWKGICCSYECAERVKSVFTLGSQATTWLGGLAIPVGWAIIWAFKEPLQLSFLPLLAALFGVMAFGIGLLTLKETSLKDAQPLALILMGPIFVCGAIYAGLTSQPQPAAVQAEQDPAQSISASDVSKTQLGENWPLTVDSGTLRCQGGGIVTFVAPSGTEYAVNGLAKGRGYPEIEPIWQVAPQIPGARMNIGSLIDRGLALCKG